MSEFQNTNPERGRKRKRRRLDEFARHTISEHEPRKGTETPTVKTFERDFMAFQNTNPERGRKLGRAFNGGLNL